MEETQETKEYRMPLIGDPAPVSYTHLLMGPILLL